MALPLCDVDSILAEIMAKTTLSTFILSILGSTAVHHIDAIHDISQNIGNINELVMQRNGSSCEELTKWAHTYTTQRYSAQISTLLLKNTDTGLRFSARHMTEDKIRDFDIVTLSQRIASQAPDLWQLLDIMLSGDAVANHQRAKTREQRMMKAKAKASVDRLGHARTTRLGPRDEGDIEMRDVGDDMENDSDMYGDAAGDSEFPDEQDDDNLDKASERREALKTIKKVVCISIMIHSSNQRCNAFQSIMGIFLHSCETPETVMEAFAHMGITISTTAINEAVRSLSKESAVKMKDLGRSFLSLYAYDNLDIDLKHSTPTIERPGDTLIHLTTGTMIPLHSTINLHDLDCCKELWEKSRLNRFAQSQNVPPIKLEHLLKILPEADDHPSGLLRRDRFNAWKFFHDLVHFGPEYFRKFMKTLGHPEVIDEIPLEKTQQVPNRALDIAPSTPSQNAEALEAFFWQAGIGDPNENPQARDIGNSVVLVFGDLLTGERIRSLLESRSEESTSWRRGQFIVYVMGLFHLKMACADAIWRIFLQPKAARVDESCLMEHVGEIRPKETGKIGSGPGFRRMHEVIQHAGIASRLDCWRLAANTEKSSCKSLEEYAKSEPTLEEIKAIANKLALEQVADAEISARRAQPDHHRDAHHENMLLRQKYFLLYEEISYAMNIGDIGRVETCFMPWSFIFQACGKHKYAAELIRYLENVHFVYPPGLKAIRLSILSNPTGKPNRFRAIDWIVEHNNLYTKRIYGGKFSNHQKKRILMESPLIEVYKNTRIQFERMFCLEHKTTHHSTPAMEKTLQKLMTHMEKHDANKFIPARKSAYYIRDAISDGLHAMMTKKVALKINKDFENMPNEIEVEDDGDLDV